MTKAMIPDESTHRHTHDATDAQDAPCDPSQHSPDNMQRAFDATEVDPHPEHPRDYTILDQPNQITMFRLLQIKYALKLEVDTGLVHSGGSVMKLANKVMVEDNYLQRPLHRKAPTLHAFDQYIDWKAKELFPEADDNASPEDREPTDDELYNREAPIGGSGVEGGIPYTDTEDPYQY